MEFPWDHVPAVPAGASAIVLCVLAAILSLKPPKEKRSQRIWAGSFVLLGILEILFIEKQAFDSSREEQSQRDQIIHLSQDIHTNEVKNSGDLGYLKGKLDQAVNAPSRPLDVGALAEALKQNDAELISRDRAVTSDKNLADQAIALASRMRAFENERKQDYSKLFFERAPEGLSASAVRDFYANQSARTTEMYNETSAMFRDQFEVQASLLRKQLEQRLTLKKIPIPVVSGSDLMAFDGVLAGPKPISEAAKYLETLARLLRE